MKFSSLLSFGLFFFVIAGFGQTSAEQAEVDSLIAALETMPEDTNKVNTYHLIATKTMYKMPEEALSYGERGLSLAETLNWKEGQLKNLIMTGTCYHLGGNSSQAWEVLERAKIMADETNNFEQLASINNLIGRIHSDKSDYLNAIKYFQESFGYAKQNEDSIMISKLYHNIGAAYYHMSNYIKALEYYEKSLIIKKKLKLKLGIALTIGNMGNIYMRQSDYPKALEYFQESLRIMKEIEYKIGIPGTLVNIGQLYSHQSEYAKALEFIEESYKKAESLGDPRVMGISLINIANVYEKQKNFEQALEYSQRSLAIKKTLNDQFGIASVFDNMGSIYLQLSDYSQALEFYEKALQISDSISDKTGACNTLNNMGVVHMNQKNYVEAQRIFKQSLLIAQELGLLTMQQDIYYNLSFSSKAMGNFSDALPYFEKYVEAKDSIFNSENTKKFTQIEEKAIYDQKMQADSLAFILEKVQINQRSQQQLTQRNYLLFGGLGLALVAFLFFRYRQQVRNRENALKLQQEQERQAQLEELDHLKSRFFANISHEFRTPLTLILGPASDLYQRATVPSDKEDLGLIQNNAQRLLRLVNQILDLSKLESGKYRLQLVESDIVSFTRRITASFQSLAQGLRIDLQFETALTQLATPFDPDMLEKTLVNLLANAVKYTPPSGKITVSLQAQQDRIAVQVTDTGTGISADHLPHIFDRFYQAQTADYTTHQPSTGIGLALVKELIEMHGGEIAVESTPELGTTFAFWIPKEKSAYQPEDFADDPAIGVSEADSGLSASASPLPVAPAPAGLSDEMRESVLVIDDNPDVRVYVKKCLGDLYQILEAFDGKEGIETAVREIPDLIITDVMMPHKDGFAVTQELKANPLTHHIPIIILTGKSSRESKLEGLEKEAEAFLTKPFDAQELRLRIQGLLSNRKRLQEKFSRRLLLEASEVEVSSQEEIFLNQAIAVVEANLGNEDFSIEQMAAELNISRVQLFRKLKALTDQSPSRFMRSIRLKRARQLIEGRAGTIAEIAYSVGFGSPTYFGKCYKEQYGTAPGEVPANQDA